jgi:CRP-like cAMP-binding protein
MIERLLLKLRLRDNLSAAEETALLSLIDTVEEVPAKKVVVTRGTPLRHSILLLDGLMCRFKDLKNGRRQISALHVPGDFLDLHGFTLKHLDQDVMALAKSQMVLVPHERLTQLTIDFPHLTRLLWFSTNLDAAIHREWEVCLGQRSGVERVAHLFCELFTRMSGVGLVEGQSFELPMSQAELGECLGLTPVHTNRVLRNLRERGLAEMKARQVVIQDMAGLKALAEFDPVYLYLDRTPR